MLTIYLFRSSRSRKGFCHSFTPTQTNVCAKTESCLERQAYGKHTRAVCGFFQVSAWYQTTSATQQQEKDICMCVPALHMYIYTQGLKSILALMGGTPWDIVTSANVR